MLESAREIMTVQANLVQHLSSQNVVRTKSRSRLFLAIVAVSVLAHGVVLGLPWPETQPSQEPPAPLPESDPEAVVDVAILPPEVLKPPVEEAVEPSEETSVAPESPAQATERSAESPSPLPTPSQPLESPPPPPQQPSEPTTPVPNPADELPPEPGSRDLTEPVVTPPATLQERLRDLNEYQHDPNKNLGSGAITAIQSWAVPGQVYPSKADTLELPYSLGEACLPAPPLRGTLMVVTDEVGNFVRGPEVISSTGYDILDEQAEEFVTKGDYRLPEDFEAKAYSVDIEVLYPDDCL